MPKYINKIIYVLKDGSKMVLYYRDPKHAMIKAERLRDLKDAGDSDIVDIIEEKVAYRRQETED